MGTITAQTVVDRVAKLMFDDTNVHWTSGELLNWLNDGQRQIVFFKPDAYVKNVSVAMVTGTKQTIPADGIRFQRVQRNMGSGGSTPGRAVRRVSMDTMDAETPDWHTAGADAVAKHYLHNEMDPKVFYLWPPQPGSPQQMEVVYSASPALVAALGNVITLDDIYMNSLVDYMVFRARSKDSKVGDNNVAGAAWQMFLQSLGVKAQGEAAFTPPDVGLPMRQGARAA